MPFKYPILAFIIRINHLLVLQKLMEKCVCVCVYCTEHCVPAASHPKYIVCIFLTYTHLYAHVSVDMKYSTIFGHISWGKKGERKLQMPFVSPKSRVDFSTEQKKKM